MPILERSESVCKRQFPGKYTTCIVALLYQASQTASTLKTLRLVGWKGDYAARDRSVLNMDEIAGRNGDLSGRRLCGV